MTSGRQLQLSVLVALLAPPVAFAAPSSGIPAYGGPRATATAEASTARGDAAPHTTTGTTKTEKATKKAKKKKRPGKKNTNSDAATGEGPVKLASASPGAPQAPSSNQSLRGAYRLIGSASVARGRVGTTISRAAPSEGTTPLAQLQRDRGVWNSLHLRNYTFRIRFSGFPIPDGYRPVTITVRNGRASAAGKQVRLGFGGLALDTVANLFAEIRHVLDDPQAGTVTVRYDHRGGFPLAASIDPIKAAVDDEFSWAIDRFRPL